MITNASTSTGRERAWRARWAAVGAAVAISFGAGGILVANATPSPTQAHAFVPVTPQRILDTRSNLGLTGPFASLTARDLQVSGSIATATGTQVVVPPESEATPKPTAVVLNVTVIGATAAGYLSIRAADAVGSPSTSSINFVAGQTIANSMTVQLGQGVGDIGKIEITYDAYGTVGPTTQVLIDVVGYYWCLGGCGGSGI